MISDKQPSMECMAYMLGQAMSALQSIQHHLVQDNSKDALKSVSEVLRDLKPQIMKHIYNIPDEKELANDAS